MKELRIVILEFAGGLRVDLMDADVCERDAVADFAGRVLKAANAPELPLFRSMSTIVPADHVSLLLNGTHSAAAMVEPSRRAAIPTLGLQNAMNKYNESLYSTASAELKEKGLSDLRAFFSHYGVEIEFGDGRPDWLSTPEQVWKGEKADG